jgi:hypothetical protein
LLEGGAEMESRMSALEKLEQSAMLTLVEIKVTNLLIELDKMHGPFPLKLYIKVLRKMAKEAQAMASEREGRDGND